MPGYESPSTRVKRQQFLSDAYPELSWATADDVLQVDAAKDATGELPSRFTQDMTTMAATLVPQRRTMFQRPTGTQGVQGRDRVEQLREQGVQTGGTSLGDILGGFARSGVGQSLGETFGRMTDFERFLTIGPSDERGIHVGRAIGEQVERVPGVGGALRDVLRIAGAPATLATAGIGPQAAAGLRGAGVGGRAVESVLGPAIQSQSFAGRLAGETAIGFGAQKAGEEIYARTENPLLALGAGLIGGVGTAGAISGVRAGVRALDEDLAGQAIRQATGAADESVLSPAMRPLEGGAVEPVIPGVSPRGRGRITGAADEVAVKPQSVDEFPAPPTVQRLFGTDVIEEGNVRGRAQRFGEELQIRADEPVSRPGLRVRDESRRAVGNQATRITATARNIVKDSGFDFDDTGRIARLAGIDPDVPGAPTLRDVAARLPNYEPYLTPQQMKALSDLRDLAAPYRQALDEVRLAEEAITGKPSTIKIGSRADVMEGGFYIPRGAAETEELADIAARRLGGSGARRGKEGFEKTATFTSEAEGIEAGYGYTDVADALGGYVRGTGNRTLDRHAANYFLTRTDDAGERLAQTAKTRMLKSEPALAREMDTLRRDVQNLRAAGARLSEKQERVIDDFFSNPNADDIDELYDAINTITIGEDITGRQGRNFGKTIPDLQADLDAVKARMADIRPEYRLAMRQAMGTPRDEGRIALRGLEQYSFPWEIADEANRILRREVGNPGEVTGALRALNSLMRGVQATGEMSYLGIQMAIGMVTDPVGYARAARAATKAWGNQGDQVLGQVLRQADARDIAKGLPDSEWWAARGLRMAESGTEFRIGGRTLPARVQAVVEAPGVRQAVSVPKSIAERADRGFGVAGDAMRRELASTMAEERMLRGLPLDDAWGKTTAESLNRATGWTPQRAFGSWGEAVNFAPRYLAARVRTLGQLASADPLKRAQARRLIGRYMAVMTTMTILGNMANGEETDFRPFSGSKGPTFNPLDAEYKNPNFMRLINVLGRDWSLMGPVDATAGLAIAAGSLVSNPTGDPSTILDRLGSVFTGPLSSLGMDWLVNKETFEGEALDNPEALGRDLMQRVVPFAAPDLVGAATGAVQDVREGDISGAVSETTGAVIQAGAGFRGAPLSRSEQVQRGEFQSLRGRDQFKGVPSEAWRVMSEAAPIKKQMGDATNIYQWRQAKEAELRRLPLIAEMEPGQQRAAIDRAIEKDPLYQTYLEVRRRLITTWVIHNPEDAVKLWNEESGKPWDERDWTPTKEQREFMDAYIRSRR